MDEVGFGFNTATPAPKTIQFNNQDGVVGTLYLESPMHFEGDAEESARTLFKFVMGFLGETICYKHDCLNRDTSKEKDDAI